MFKSLFQQFFAKDNQELVHALKSRPLLLDVRTPSEFKSASIDGAVNIPVQNISNAMTKLRKSDVIVTFCKSGSRSAMATEILRKNGFDQVINGGSWRNVEDVISKYSRS